MIAIVPIVLLFFVRPSTRRDGAGDTPSAASSQPS
jgi:hypothetical protein